MPLVFDTPTFVGQTKVYMGRIWEWDGTGWVKKLTDGTGVLFSLVFSPVVMSSVAGSAGVDLMGSYSFTKV